MNKLSNIKKNIPKIAKNFLVFLPVIISNLKIDISIIQDLFIGFLFFTFISFYVYFTNDFIDKEKDKYNKLKKNSSLSVNLNKKDIIFINIFLIIFLLLLSRTIYFDFVLIGYIAIFYIYTFLKKVKFLDLVCLNSFYIFRLIYGCKLINIDISLLFIIFFVSVFLILSIFKRMIQINVNNLKEKNDIIAYDKRDLKFLNLILLISFLASSLIFILFIFHNNYLNIEHLLSSSTNLNFDKISYIIIYLLYVLNMGKFYTDILENNIKTDLIEYLFKSKLVLISCIVILSIIAFNK